MSAARLFLKASSLALAAVLAIAGLSGLTPGNIHAPAVHAAALSVTCSPASVPSAVAGRPDTFNVTVNSPPAAVTFTYSWAFDDGFHESTQQVSHAFSTAGSHSAIANVFGSNGDTGTCSVPVTVTGNLVLTLQAPSTMAVGQPVSLTATLTGANSTFTFSWTFGDGQSGNTTGTGSGGTATSSITHTYNAACTCTISVSASSASTSQSAGPVTATITITGSASSTTINGPFTGRTAQSIAMTATTSPSTGVVSYSWNFGDGTAPAQFGASVNHTYNATGTFTVTATPLDVSGAPLGTAGTTTATITAGLQVSAQGPYTGTVGLPVSFTASAPNAPADTVYSWNFGDGQTGSGLSVSHVYTTPCSPCTVTLSATSASSGSSGQAQTTATISVATTFTVTINGPTQGSANIPLSFTASPASSVPTDTVYTWTFGDGQSATGATVSHTWTSPGTYSVSVTAASASTGARGTAATISVSITASGPTRSYPAGWNLVGAPAGTVFSQGLNPLYTLQSNSGGSYTQVANTQGVAAGQGYWVYFNAPITIGLSGTSQATATVQSVAGCAYVMIGNPSATATVQVSGADIVYVYSSSSGYQVATSLTPGQGAWACSYAGTPITVGP